MKSKMLFFAAALLANSVMAQDTLQSCYPPSNYFYSSWQQFDSLAEMGLYGPHMNGDMEAFYMMTQDTLTIYGIAAGLTNPMLLYPSEYPHDESGDWWWSHYVDTTYTKVYDNFRIFEADPGSLRQVGEDLEIYLKATPIAYYVDLGLRRIYGQTPLPVFPMYERYFVTPVTVADSFYIGRNFQACRPAGTINSTLPIDIVGINNGSIANHKMAFHIDTSFAHTLPPEEYMWYYTPAGIASGNYCPFLFPILTPDSNSHDDTQDTIVPGGDTIVPGIDTTTAVRQADMLRRYTGVQPNPATGKVQVVSSFGMTRVEVYDAAGKRRYEGEATGLVHTVNVEGWPAGTYLVRIHTPLGTATKKLIVRSE